MNPPHRGKQYRHFPATATDVIRNQHKITETSGHLAGGQAAGFLADAWASGYGLHPEPTTAYRDLVRASNSSSTSG